MAKYRKQTEEGYIYYDGNSIVDGDKRIFNPTHQQMIDAGWEEYEDPAPTEEELLQQAKQNKINDINIYDSSDEVNQFTVNGEQTWVEATLRAQLRISVQAYKALGIETVTKVWQGKEYTFPTDLWLTMLNQVEVYASECFNMTQRHIANVQSLQDRTEVEEYNYMVGYPEKLVFGEEEE